jgi:hypothetical protein
LIICPVLVVMSAHLISVKWPIVWSAMVEKVRRDIMKKNGSALLVAALAAVLLGLSSPVQSSELKVKVLTTPVDASKAKHGILVGRDSAGGMLIRLELGWRHRSWLEFPEALDKLYHVDVTPFDPKSKTRIPCANVTFEAINKDTGKTVKGSLHPMWGGTGLHYAFNSGLAGDGTYEATVSVRVPTFARDLEDKRWLVPAVGKFHFKLAGGKLTEVTEPE